MIQLWDFQQELVDRTRASISKHKNVLLQAPTGAGKTRIAAHIIDSAIRRGKRVFFNCHRVELVDQTVNTLKSHDITPSIIQAGRRYEGSQVSIASIDTLKNRLSDITPPDLMIWDEAHHIRAGGWSKIHERFPDCYHLGLSATPIRSDGKGLDANFDAIVEGPQVYDLIQWGYLADYDIYSRELNFEDTQDGFITVAGDVLDSYLTNAPDKIAIGFAPSVHISQQLAAHFTSAGVAAAHLDGGMNKHDRKRILLDLANGRIQVVFNCNLFAEGFDINANTGMDVTIGCLIDCQKTTSLSRWLQKCGRALRKQDGRAVINDHAGNFYEHGAPCDIRSWSLEGVSCSEEAMRQCPKCYYANDAVSTCIDCSEFLGQDKNSDSNAANEKKLSQVSQLEKIDLTARRSFIDTATPDELKAYEKQRGYKRGWHKHILRARAEKHLLISKAKQIGADVNYTMKPKQIREVIRQHECT